MVILKPSTSTDVLKQDLARAEAVISAAQTGTKRLHGPTVDSFKGQALALRRAIALLDMEQITPRGPLEIHRIHTFQISWKGLAFLVCGGIIWYICLSKFLS